MQRRSNSATASWFSTVFTWLASRGYPEWVLIRFVCMLWMCRCFSRACAGPVIVGRACDASRILREETVIRPDRGRLLAQSFGFFVGAVSGRVPGFPT